MSYKEERSYYVPDEIFNMLPKSAQEEIQRSLNESNRSRQNMDITLGQVQEQFRYFRPAVPVYCMRPIETVIYSRAA